MPSTQSVAQTATTERAGTNDLLYIDNAGNNSITVYRHDASGNAAPLYVISGSNTGISSPGQLSEDAQGNLFVANGTFARPPSVSPSILVFAHGAHGNVPPIRKLIGPLTRIHNVSAMTVSRHTGTLFVADFLPETGFDAVSTLRFAPNANGNVAPLAHAE